MAGKVIICDNNVSASGGGCGLKTVELSNYRVYRAKLSSYRTIEYIEQNCRVIKLSSISSKTVELSNYRAGTSKLSQYRSLEQSYTVLTHGLHVRALALRHSPLQAT